MGFRAATHRMKPVATGVICAAMALGPAVPARALATPVASVSDASVAEGNAGSTTASFTITLSESEGTTTVTYQTADGNATAGSDYTSISGTVTFGPGEVQKTVTVAVTGDLLDEADETYNFVLTQIDNGTFQGGDPDGVGTIFDDDATPALSIGDATVTEGNSGTATTSVTVSLSAASGRIVTVGFGTVDGTATFSPGADYHQSSGTLVFAPGETSKTVTLTVVSDTTDESDESFFVDLTSPTNATATDARGIVTITDDDAPGQGPPPGNTVPTLSVTDAVVTEGNLGTVQTTVAVSLSAASNQDVGVSFATADGSATFADADYHSGGGRLVFSPGETSKTVTLTIVGDTVDEPNESFVVDLSAPVGATIADGHSIVTITDDDATTTQPPPPSGSVPSISIADADVTEGTGDETNVAATVTLSSASSSQVGVDFATSDGTASFTNGDYWQMSGRLVFAPGETSRTLTATVVGDSSDEENETFFIDLSDPANGTISDGRAQVTITDDDGPTAPPGGTVPAISISDASVTEGNADTTIATLTLSLSVASTRPIAVDVATTDGTAVFEDADYYEGSGRLVFQAGETTQSLQMFVVGDTRPEGDEQFHVDLSNPLNATISDARGTITIRDDDAPTETHTSLALSKRRIRVVASGQVVPPQPGERMRVVLKKRRDGRFVNIAVRRPVLGEALDRDGDGVFESAYDTRFDRPKRGRCLIRAIFPGTAAHARSAATKRFHCSEGISGGAHP